MHFMTDSRPLVSIIVPVYNAEKYLPYCVDSILAQSYQTLEIILVDDGATDKSPQICDSYAALDSRVHVIHQENGGIAKAQNAGLDAAHGEYVAFADNDDILDCHNIEFLLHALLNSGSDMSKARWQQFGISQLNEVKSIAAVGATAPNKVTAFKNPLQSYQTVFCIPKLVTSTRQTGAAYTNENCGTAFVSPKACMPKMSWWPASYTPVCIKLWTSIVLCTTGSSPLDPSLIASAITVFTKIISTRGCQISSMLSAKACFQPAATTLWSDR